MAMIELLLWGYLAFALLVGIGLKINKFYDDWDEIVFAAGIWPITLGIITYFWLFYRNERK